MAVIGSQSSGKSSVLEALVRPIAAIALPLSGLPQLLQRTFPLPASIWAKLQPASTRVMAS